MKTHGPLIDFEKKETTNEDVVKIKHKQYTFTLPVKECKNFYTELKEFSQNLPKSLYRLAPNKQMKGLGVAIHFYARLDKETDAEEIAEQLQTICKKFLKEPIDIQWYDQRVSFLIHIMYKEIYDTQFWKG